MNTDTLDMETTLEKINFDASQRCDRCGAQAKYQIIMSNGFDLLFCNHHKSEYGIKLEQVALTIRSDSDSV